MHTSTSLVTQNRLTFLAKHYDMKLYDFDAQHVQQNISGSSDLDHWVLRHTQLGYRC